MALKNLFDMVKADRYTADGREEIIKAQEAETEDKVYQIGEISQKTGLQKTANGWVKPKNGKQPGAKKEESKAAPKSLAGTPMKKADLNSKDPYEITHSMKPDTASEAKEMDKISAFMQEETGATLRNAITARESFYKNTKNPTPEQQEGLAALMKIQQKLGYGKPAEGPALNGQKKTVSHQEYRNGPMYGPAGSKSAEPQRSEAYRRGEKFAKPAEQRQSAGYRYWQGVLSGYDDESLLEQRKSLQEQVDDFEDDIKRYDKQDMANAVYAKRIDAKNFQIGALKAIDEEMESRGMDPAPRTSVPDSAPSLSEIVDRVYNIGEISEKTGLQKTANGWRPVKKGAAGKTNRASKEEAIRKDLGLTEGEDMSRFSDEQIEKMYAKTQQTPEQQKADFDKSKIGQAVNKGRQEFAAEKTRQKELASKTNAIGLPKESKSAGDPDAANKAMETNEHVKNLEQDLKQAQRTKAGPDKEFNIKYKILETLAGGTDAAFESFKEAKKTTASKEEALEQALNKYNYSTKGKDKTKKSDVKQPAGTRHAEKRKTNRPKAIRWNRDNLNEMRGNEEYINAKAADNYYHQYGLDKIGEWKDRKGWTIKEYQNDDGETYRAKYNGEKYVGSEYDPTGEILSPENKDAAPRVLTGDCRIRIRKEKPALTGDTKIRVRK